MSKTKSSPNTPSPMELRRLLMDTLQSLEALSSPSRTEREALGKVLLKTAKASVWQPFLLKELENCSPDQYHRLEALSTLILEIGSLKDWQAPLYELVTKKNVSDDVKEITHIILRTLGDNTDPDFFFEHMKDPAGMLDREAVRIFNMAENNPDAISEFLDAFLEVDTEEALEIFEALKKNVPLKFLSCFLVPYLLTMPEAVELRLWCLQMLGESATPIAGWAIYNRYIRYEAPEEVGKKELTVAKAALKKLQLAGAFHPENTNDASLYPHLSTKWQQNVKHVESYGTPFTGEGDQICFLVIHWQNGERCFMAVFLNEEYGLLQCVVNNQLTEAEAKRCFIQFHDTPKHYPISPAYFKQKMQEAEKQNFDMYQPIPPEYIIWKTLLDTIAPAPPVDYLQELQRLAKPMYRDKTASLIKESALRHSFLELSSIPALDALSEVLLNSWKKTYTASVKRFKPYEKKLKQGVISFPAEDFPELLKFIIEIDAYCRAVHKSLQHIEYLPHLQKRLAEYLYLTRTPKQRKIPALMATEALQLEDSPTPQRFFLQYLRTKALKLIEEAVYGSDKVQEIDPIFALFILFIQLLWEDNPETLQAIVADLKTPSKKR